MSQPVVQPADIATLNNWLQRRFPETYSEDGKSEALQERIEEAIIKNPELITVFNQNLLSPYLHRKRRGEEVASLVVLLETLAGEKPQDDIIARAKSVLSGKRVLSLGDDSGSLTEVLRSFGAETLGVEYSAYFVTLGQRGVLSEKREPQPIIQGDIWELPLPKTKITQEALRKGPYDLIVSCNLFDLGSGGEMPRKLPEGRTLRNALLNYIPNARKLFGETFNPPEDLITAEPSEPVERAWFQIYIAGMNYSPLLTKRGVQLHLHTQFSTAIGASQLTIRAEDPRGGIIEGKANHYLPREPL